LFCHVDQDDLVIEVSDSGSGIPESARPKLFTPFFTTKESGTGLGLSAVHKIVSSHGGRIAVVDGRRDAEAGQQYPGVTFVITLPRHA
jgi:signal transduction histidine kinase